MNEQRQQGVIKTLNSRGFGFITSDNIDYFFHHTDFHKDWKGLIQRWLQNGKTLEVEFTVDLSSSEGPKANDVVLLDEVSER